MRDRHVPACWSGRFGRSIRHMPHASGGADFEQANSLPGESSHVRGLARRPWLLTRPRIAAHECRGKRGPGEKGLSTIPGRTDTILRILSRRPLLPSERAEGLPSFGDGRFQSGCGWSQGGERWRRKARHQSNVRSVDSNCARSCPWPTAPSMRWSSAASSRDASRSRPGALYGIWAKSKHGSLRVDPHPSPVRNIPMLCNGALGR
jgi:hypothetical protein